MLATFIDNYRAAVPNGGSFAWVRPAPIWACSRLIVDLLLSPRSERITHNPERTLAASSLLDLGTDLDHRALERTEIMPLALIGSRLLDAIHQCGERRLGV